MLDAMVTTSTALIGIESKRFEPFRRNSNTSFTDTYLRQVWGDRMSGYQAIRDDIRKGEKPYHFLDAGQLVKHALALRSEVHRRGGKLSPVLHYVYAEPKQWPSGKGIDPKEIRRHRKEILRFGQAVQNDEVSFLACSYRDLLRQWKAQAKKAIADHANAVFLRFEPWGISGLKPGWRDSKVWMDTATHLYMKNREGRLLGKPLGRPQIADAEMNVACVCAGYASRFFTRYLYRSDGGPRSRLTSRVRRIGI